jgi:hypothetical protein
MAASADQSPSRTAGDDRNLVTIDENYLAPSFEDRVMIFWEKHGRTVIALLVIVALALVGRWAFQIFAESRERAVAAEYAQASDSAALRAFAEAHPQAVLAGAAKLRVADEAYSAGDYAMARAAYEEAAKSLAGKILGDRARLGAAVATLQGGDESSARAALESLANDLAAQQTLRAEAAFHLASVARAAGRSAEAGKWSDLALATDPTSLWAQRAVQLRSTLPADLGEASVDAATSTTESVVVEPSAAAPAESGVGESSSVSFPGSTR